MLLKKGGRKLATTDAGRALYDRCERIAGEVADAGLGAIRDQQELRGTLRVSMPVDFTAWLSSAIAAFAVQHPEIDLVIDANSRWVDVTEEPYDVAVHLGSAPASQAGARALARIARGIYASPDFLARHGAPGSLNELAAFDCVVTEHQRSEGVWTFRDAAGGKIDIAGRVTVNNVAVARQLVIGGVGLGIMANIMCENDVRAGRLTRVLIDEASPPLEVTATFLGRRKESLRLRVFLDFMAAKLGG